MIHGTTHLPVPETAGSMYEVPDTQYKIEIYMGMVRIHHMGLDVQDPRYGAVSPLVVKALRKHAQVLLKEHDNGKFYLSEKDLSKYFPIDQNR